MNVFFDTEFTGLEPGAKLMSLGMVTDNSQRFYAEFSDYDILNLSEWVEENVFNHLLSKQLSSYRNISLYKKNSSEIQYEECDENSEHLSKIVSALPDFTRYVYGDSKTVAKALREWFYIISNKKQLRIQLISDVCHYDMTLLCNLFGGAFNLPSNVNPVCYDICQDIWAFLVDDYDNLSEKMRVSFDVSREMLIKSINYDDEANKPKGIKHNSLYDAEVIKYIYRSSIGD